MFRQATVWMIAAGVFLYGAVTLAADDKADALINQAVALRRSGDDQAAYTLLQEAYELSHSPRAAGQRGLCEHALGRWADAEAHVTEALKATGDPWVKKSRPVLEQSLVASKSHIARIEISGEPIGAEVLVNGGVVGRLPMTAPVRVGVGEVEVELRAPGYARASKSMHVEGGQYQKVVLRAEVERVPASPPPVVAGSGSASPSVTNLTVVMPPQSASTPGSGSATSSTPAAAAAPSPSAPRSEDAAPSVSMRGAAKWVAFGLGAASLGLGVFGFSRQRSASSDFNMGCAVNQGGVIQMVLGSNRTAADCISLNGRIDSAYKLELVGFIAAGALGVAGLVFWLTEPSRGEAKSASLACSPAILPHGAPAAGCSFRF